jgi:SHS2 domain-containing protein
MDYKYLDHTADASFEAYGDTLAKAFSNAAIALRGIMVESVEPKEEKEIIVTAKNEEALLFDFINEFVFLLDVESFLLSKVISLTIEKVDEGFELKCVCMGDHHMHYDVKSVVKSATYNDMLVEKTDEGYRLRVVVDI